MGKQEWTVCAALYEASKRSLANRLECQTDTLPEWGYAACSGSAAATAAVVTHPLDVVKTRLQVKQVPNPMR